MSDDEGSPKPKSKKKEKEASPVKRKPKPKSKDASKTPKTPTKELKRTLSRKNSLLSSGKSGGDGFIAQLKRLASGLSSKAEEHALVEAAKYGEVDRVKELIKARPRDVDDPDPKGYTPLMHAAREGEKVIVKVLVRAKANTNILNKDEQTALHLAAAKGYRDIVILLLNGGAKINTLDRFGMTPLVYAAFNDKVEIVKILLDEDPKLEKGSEVGQGTALVAACKQGNKEIADLLLDAKARVDGTNGKKESALIAACDQKGTSALVKALIERKAAITDTDSHGRTALHKACMQGDLDVVELLIPAAQDHKALDMQDYKGDTALFHAAQGPLNASLLRVLLEAKANANLQNKEGDTPMMAAAALGLTENIKNLILWGHASADYRNKSGFTALRIAHNKDHKEAIKLLKNETTIEEDPSLTMLSGGDTGARGQAGFVGQFGTSGAGKPTASQAAH